MKEKAWLLKFFVVGMAGMLFMGCQGNDDTNNTDFEDLSHYYRDIQNLKIEVAYEKGAEPYSNMTNGDYWDFTSENIAALFSNEMLKVDVDNEAGDMLELPAQNKESFSAEDLLNLWRANFSTSNTPTDAYLYLLFVDGFFQDTDGQNLEGVIGVNITGTPVTAVFMPVVERSSRLLPTRAFVEQTTVIHEMGHAVGLVNNGVPLTSEHQDVEHGAHCTNQECVMYWLNEGVADMIAYIQRFQETGSKVIFGDECLKDTRSYRP
ncbi:hypothetical protein [Aureibacter tunicatorum]|uniref:Zn-dependent protease n=1 Tax=Aureibacter tunicatorum TaxID=866807 RepID=A0AAE4BNV6_9BACT|nr:hypothetical protein [Aureibacter tunicatorum]MDR6237249.1 putative Zn-dependent protease [Aureibacter tunicatorum]BDD06241.1 hypothetical protein AUTU_37240 [Aureibacter tunicatorum]